MVPISRIIKFGVLGTASVAKKYVFRAIATMSEKFELAAIASRDKNKALQYTREYGGQPFEGYEDLIHCKDIDAVYVPLPNSLHYEWIRKAIESGKHVLAEKPLACSYEQTKELCDLAFEKKLVLMENFQFRFHPQTQYIKDVMQSGALGEIRCFRSSFGFPPLDRDNIRYKKELLSGALLDAGAYPVKATHCFCSGEYVVAASELSVSTELGVDLWGNAMLVNRNENIVSQISFGFDNYYQCNVELWCSKGKITANRIFTAPPGFEAKVIIETAAGIQEKSFVDNHFTNMLEYFYDIVDKGLYSSEIGDNIKQSKVIQEIREKALIFRIS